MFFKVTTENLRSLYGSYFPKFRVQYSTEHFVKSKAGKLFCYNFDCVIFNPFVELEEHEATFPEYPIDSNTRKLWICECVNPVYLEYVVTASLYDVEDSLENGLFPQPSSIACGPKAVLADEIKLVREIDLNELQELYAEYKKGC